MEILINISVWSSAVLFSLYNVYIFGKDVDKSLLYPEDLTPGWSFIGRLHDVSDYEWNSWKAFALSLLPWIGCHVLISDILRRYKTTLFAIKLWQCTLPAIFITHHFSFKILLVLSAQPIIYFMVLKRYGNIASIWCVTSFFLLVMNAVKYLHDIDGGYFLSALDLTEDDFYLILISASWIQLRCISYSFEMIKLNDNVSFLELESYCFYLPLLFLGPVILYNDFVESYSVKNSHLTVKKLANFTVNLIRFIGWYMFLEICLHFFYFNALQYNLQLVQIMPDWCLYGGGLWMGLHFYIKYLVTYGIASSLAVLDNIRPETPPLCIARVHLYSQMWRYFDVGLHKFLIRYIYKPIIDDHDKKGRYYLIVRSFSSLLCFTFVLFWHGTHGFIFIWTMLNYFGIILENIGVTISKSKFYTGAVLNIFKTEAAKDRLQAFVSAPVLVLSAVSNFYFFAGSDIGVVYVNRVIDQSFLHMIGMFLCLYCCCRCSQYFINVRVKRVL